MTHPLPRCPRAPPRTTVPAVSPPPTPTVTAATASWSPRTRAPHSSTATSGPRAARGARAGERPEDAREGAARPPAGAADFDGDGKDELILNWAADTSFGLYGEHPTHWWIADGTGSRDATSFSTTEFARDGS
ncbi:hypothetical protein NKH77_01980 [Streptomyces sp. M19]